MGSPTLAAIDVTSLTFESLYSDLITSAKADRVTPLASASAVRPIAAWGNTVDDMTRRLALRSAFRGVSVVETGAEGGGEDDTTAIQEAIDQVDDAGGGTVLLPWLGAALVHGALTLRAGVRLHYTLIGSPEGVAYGTTGDRATRLDGTEVEYVKTGGAGDTGWVVMSGSPYGITPTLSAGQTIEEGLALEWQDNQGTPVTRAVEDFNDATWRRRYYTAAAALAATLAVNTTTGALSYDGAVSFTQPVQVHGASSIRSGAGAPDNGVGSNGDYYLRTNGGIDTSLYVKIAGAWVAFTATGSGTTANATLRWSGTDWVENTTFRVADSASSPTAQLRGNGTSESTYQVYASGTLNAEFGLVGTHTLVLRWRDGLAAPEATLDYATGTKTWRWRHDNGSSNVTAASLVLSTQVLTVGSASTGINPIIAVNADTAGTGTIAWQVEGTTQWAGVVDASDNFAFNKAGGVAVWSVAQSTSLMTFAGSATWASASPALTLGDGTGVPGLWFVKEAAQSDDAIRFYITSAVDANRRWHIRFGSDEDLNFNRYDAAGALISSAMALDWDTGNVTYSGSATWASASPTLTVGDATGTVELNLRKSDAGVAVIDFEGGSAGSGIYWRIQSSAAETFIIERFHNSVSQGTPFTVTTAGTITLGESALSSTHTWFGAIHRFSDVSTDATNKNARLTCYHYTSAEEPFGIYLQSTSTANVVNVGGGSSLMNAATTINFLTAATTTTTTGTNYGSLSSTGGWTFGASGNLLTHVVFGTGFLVGRSSADATTKSFALYVRPYTTADGTWTAIMLDAPSAGSNIVHLGWAGTIGPTEVRVATAPDATSNTVLRTSWNSAGRMLHALEFELDGTLNHDGSLVGFFGFAPAAQVAVVAALTDNSGGTANDTVEALTSGTVYADDVAAIRNNFADLTAKTNALLVFAKAHGLMAAA